MDGDAAEYAATFDKKEAAIGQGTHAVGFGQRLRCRHRLPGYRRGGIASSERIQFASAEIVGVDRDRKSTRLIQSLMRISYAVFCLKNKKTLSIQLSP